ncbi:plasmid mobilization relaxosome protein MobC [Streptomyces rubradiris]|uniref:plasmid mobilization protein n=1 Tax=Streptomyces rubradiris TaxID=285531 RepID=UPI0036E057CA
MAGAGRHQEVPARQAATEGGSQPEKKPSPRTPRATKQTSRKRSPKPTAHKRDYVCSVRLNDDEKTQLAAAARATRTSLPAFLARSGLAAAQDLDNTAAAIAGHRELVTELFAARRHLGQVGNNLNQIARALNTGAHPADLDTVVAAIQRAVSRVQAATDRLLEQR